MDIKFRAHDAFLDEPSSGMLYMCADIGVNQSLLQSIKRFINYVNITILMTKWKQDTDWNINMKPDILKQTRYSSEPVPLTWFHAQLVFKCIVFEATYFIHSYIGSVYGLWWHHIGF